MSVINNGGPAFPSNDYGIQHDGMSLRDWLAGHETLADVDCPGIIIGMELLAALAGPCPEKTYDQDPVAWVIWESNWRAKLKYIRADAMLKARGGAA